MAPNVTTTTMSPTTPRSEPIFRVNDANGDACILEQLKATFNISYNKTVAVNKTEMAVANFVLPETAMVDQNSSMCSNTTMAAVTLTFEDNGSNFVQVFAVSGNGSSLTSISLTLMHSQALFPNSTDAGKLIKYSGSLPTSTFLVDNGTSYVCRAEQTFTIDNQMVNVTFSGVTVQTAGITNDTFGKGVKCPQDTPTTTVPSTTTLSPTLSPPAAFTWNVTGKDGKICMLVKMYMNFTINYENKENKTANITVNLPSSASDSKSACGNTTAEFVLDFFDGWMLVMDFELDDASNQYNNTNLSLLYSLDYHFVKPKYSGTNVTVSTNQTGIKAAVNQSYSCNAETTWQVENVLFMVKNLQVQPFAAPLNGTFGHPASCPADEKFNNIVPIAVGCALAGLVIIVLIAYLIGRQRSSKTGYESV